MSNPAVPSDVVKQPQGFGAEFCAARTKRVMSTADVAGELNILKRHVEAIENEHYENLPQRAFARGFVINYAKLLGLNPNEMVAKFDAGYPKHLAEENLDTIKAPLQPMGTLTRGRMPIRFNFGLIVGIVAVLIFGVVILKMVSTAKQETTPASVDSQVADSLSISEQAQGAAIGNTGSALGGVGSAAQGAVLDFWVKEATDISVVDSTGQTLMTGNQTRGGHQLSGVPPFKVEIASAAAVDLNYNQNPVDLSVHTQDGKATLTLQ